MPPAQIPSMASLIVAPSTDCLIAFTWSSSNRVPATTRWADTFLLNRVCGTRPGTAGIVTSSFDAVCARRPSAGTASFNKDGSRNGWRTLLIAARPGGAIPYGTLSF